MPNSCVCLQMRNNAAFVSFDLLCGLVAEVHLSFVLTHNLPSIWPCAQTLCWGVRENFPAGITRQMLYKSLQYINAGSYLQQHRNVVVLPTITHIHLSRVFWVWAARSGCLWEEIWSQRVELPCGSLLTLSSMSVCHVSNMRPPPAQCGLSGLLLQLLNTST